MPIAAIIALITQLGPLGVQLFLALESRMTLGPDEKLNIANAIAASNTTDQETLNRVHTWMTTNGFGVQITFVAKQ